MARNREVLGDYVPIPPFDPSRDVVPIPPIMPSDPNLAYTNEPVPLRDDELNLDSPVQSPAVNSATPGTPATPVTPSTPAGTPGNQKKSILKTAIDRLASTVKPEPPKEKAKEKKEKGRKDRKKEKEKGFFKQIHPSVYGTFVISMATLIMALAFAIESSQ